MTVFAYLFPIVIFGVGIYKPKSRFVSVLFAVYFVILMGLNTGSPDYSSYKMQYDHIGDLSFNVEPGFKFFISACKAIGLTYQEFRMVFASVYALLTVISIARLTPYKNYVLSLFLFLPFILNVSGIRFALASMIVCFGIPFLLPSRKRGVQKFLLCLLVAVLVHRGAILYFILCFSRKKLRVPQCIMLGLCIVIGISLVRSPLPIMFIETFVPNSELFVKWLVVNGEGSGLNIVGFSLNVGLLIAMVFWACYLGKVICGYSEGFAVDIKDVVNEENQRTQLLKNVAILSLLTIPGYTISSEYQRYLFGITIVFYSIFARFMYEVCLDSKGTKILYNAISILLPFFLLALYMYSMPSHNVMQTFVDNLVFKRGQ